MLMSDYTLGQLLDLVNNKTFNAYITRPVTYNGQNVRVIVVTNYSKVTTEFEKRVVSKLVDLGFTLSSNDFMNKVPLLSKEQKLDEVKISTIYGGYLDFKSKSKSGSEKYGHNTVITIQKIK